MKQFRDMVDACMWLQRNNAGYCSVVIHGDYYEHKFDADTHWFLERQYSWAFHTTARPIG